MAADDLTRWANSDEGQFFERKSAWVRTNSGRRPRPPKDVARDIADTLVAMANADGGELVIGIEDDDLRLSGVPFPSDQISFLLGVPRDPNYVDPILPAQGRVVVAADGQSLLHYQVEWSPDVHRRADGRYLLRVGDSNKPFAADQIAALKTTKAQGLYERSFPPGASLDDLNMNLVSALMASMRQEATEEDFLRRYRLVERRNGYTVPCMAALLLFGNDPLKWHPRCGVDFVRWDGVERRFGADLNVAKRIRVEDPLAVLVEKSHEAIRPFIRERQQLQNLLFTERLEYPTFVWQEAIVNAVAHRDYSIHGAPVEVWMFDDRIEVRSPGLPPKPVTVDALNQRQHLHISRNPLMVRVLADLGYMRELGEGVPRMFAVMETEGFYPPRFTEVGSALFQVTLRNQPIYDQGTLEWLQQFREIELSGNQKRLLAYGHAHGDRFTNREYQRLAGLDIYGASNSIKEMTRAGVVRPVSKGSRVYEILEPLRAQSDIPESLSQLLPLLKKKREISNEDVRQLLDVSRLAAARRLSELCKAGWLEKVGGGRWTRYRRAVRHASSTSIGPITPD